MDPLIPKMNAESGFDVTETDVAPLRISGYLCLLLGCLSILGLIGRPLIFFSVASVIVGVVALRRFNGLVPLGVKPARVGICLAIGFGVCSFFTPWFKTFVLSRQAEKFALIYLDIVAMGETEFAMELNKDYVNRMDPTMSLEEHYQGAPQARENFEQFHQSGVNKIIRERGVGAEWVFDTPTRLYTRYLNQHAQLVIADPTGETESKISMTLDYLVDSQGRGQWHVSNVQSYRSKRLVAPNVL